MNKKSSKKETEKQIQVFFLDIKKKTPKEIKKIKKLAMKQNIPLRDLRKTFCKKCFSFYSGTEKIRIKKGIKSIKCNNCGNVAKWKIKN